MLTWREAAIFDKEGPSGGMAGVEAFWNTLSDFSTTAPPPHHYPAGSFSFSFSTLGNGNQWSSLYWGQCMQFLFEHGGSMTMFKRLVAERRTSSDDLRIIKHLAVCGFAEFLEYFFQYFAQIAADIRRRLSIGREEQDSGSDAATAAAIPPPPPPMLAVDADMVSREVLPLLIGLGNKRAPRCVAVLLEWFVNIDHLELVNSFAYQAMESASMFRVFLKHVYDPNAIPTNELVRGWFNRTRGPVPVSPPSVGLLKVWLADPRVTDESVANLVTSPYFRTPFLRVRPPARFFDLLFDDSRVASIPTAVLRYLANFELTSVIRRVITDARFEGATPDDYMHTLKDLCGVSQNHDDADALVIDALRGVFIITTHLDGNQSRELLMSSIEHGRIAIVRELIDGNPVRTPRRMVDFSAYGCDRLISMVETATDCVRQALFDVCNSSSADAAAAAHLSGTIAILELLLQQHLIVRDMFPRRPGSLATTNVQGFYERVFPTWFAILLQLHHGSKEEEDGDGDEDLYSHLEHCTSRVASQLARLPRLDVDASARFTATAATTACPESALPLLLALDAGKWHADSFVSAVIRPHYDTKQQSFLEVEEFASYGVLLPDLWREVKAYLGWSVISRSR